MPVHGGRLAAQTLKAAGVEYVFTLSGGHVMPIYDGCLDEGIVVVDVRHEQAAVHAADAWARINPGKIGVAILTAGPGVTDGVTGVANAWRANSPILVIGGQGPFMNRQRGSLQEMDHVSLMRPITKWSDGCYQTERIPETIATAMRHAVSGIPGPAFLEIPLDVLMNPVEMPETPIGTIATAPSRATPPRTDMITALRILASAKRPLLIAGTSVKWSGAQGPLNRFLAKTHIPAYVNGMGRGTIPWDSLLLFKNTRRRAIEHCDAIVLAGAILDFRLAFGSTIPKDAKIIQMEMDSTLIGYNRPADVGLVGNLACTLDAMIDVMNEQAILPEFREYSAELRAEEDAAETKLRDRLASDAVPIEAMRLCKEIADFVDDDMIVIGDGGDIVAQAAKVVPVPKNGAWMDPGPLGTLGVGMPFAIASQLARPDKRVLVIFGDGSFGFNGFEYDTAVRFNLPIVGIVGNDAAWGQMMRPQGALYGPDRLVATKLARTRYDRIVEAMGGHGENVERPDEIRPALERAFASGKPACVNVVIKQDMEYRGGGYV
ncbi:MAG: hypothetical protein JXQ73_23395 [Phycisphaerae bacterium]|nr:hypothetical protein [Phycisphaerae bacterium]